MAAIGCELQEVPEAATGNGLANVAPFSGLLTTTVVPVVAVAACATLMATLVTHEAPWFPHDLTCSVCEPAAALTLAEIDEAFTMIVLELLSSE